MFTLNLKRCKMVKDKWRSICVIVPLTNKSGKLKFNVKSIIPMERLAYWYKIACEIQRTISYFLQTLLKVVTQLCLALCDPMDWSLPGSSIHGIFQARVLEGVAIAFSNLKMIKCHLWKSCLPHFDFQVETITIILNTHHLPI